MPPIRTGRPSKLASRAISLATRSVVRIASAARSPPVDDSASTRGDTPASSVGIGIGTPMTPVEQIRTASEDSPSAWATAAVAVSLSLSPSSPVQALA